MHKLDAYCIGKLTHGMLDLYAALFKLQSLVGVDVDAVVSDDTLWSMITWPVSVHNSTTTTTANSSKRRPAAAAPIAVISTTHAARCIANEFATITNRCVH
jgi:hypothetical protein